MRLFHRNVAECTFGTGSTRWVIFDYHVNEFMTHLFIPQRVLHGGGSATYFREETCIFGKNKINVEVKESGT